MAGDIQVGDTLCVSFTYVDGTGSVIAMDNEAATISVMSKTAISSGNPNFFGGFTAFYNPVTNLLHIGDYGKGPICPEDTSNNVKVTVKRVSQEAPEGSIFRMTLTERYGGTRGGLGEGTRIFFAGDGTSKIMWSDVIGKAGKLQNLYVSENSCAYVGDENEPITAIKQQSNMLIIFQPHSIHYMQYYEGSSPTEDDITAILAGTVTDLSSYKVTLPITPISNVYGCDCPNTVQLCGNRLVWLSSDGNVYTLVTANQYSETNVRKVSMAIEKELRRYTKEQLQAAYATDWNGHYALHIANKIYLMDYEKSGFAYYTSYGSDKNAQKGIAWWIWSAPAGGGDICCMHSCDGVLYVECIKDDTVTVFSLTDGAESSEDFDCSFATKQFDFGAPEQYKKCGPMYMNLAGEDVAVQVVTERGDSTEYAPECDGELRQVRLHPQDVRFTQMGVRVKGKGALSAAGMTIKLKTMGAIR
jgi:hypothetical protein